MRKFLIFLLFLLLLAFSAQADSNWADTADFIPQYAELLMRMATREGPSTDYVEPGSYFQKGESVTVISIDYDENNVPWVQVEFAYRGGYMRAYTGLKRVDISPSLLPSDSSGVTGTVTARADAYRGPGTWYVKYDFTVPKGTQGVIYNIENDYAQFAYRQDNGNLRLVWVSTSNLSSPYYIPKKADVTPSWPTWSPYGPTQAPSTSGSAHVLWSCQPYAGPGTQYAQFDYLVYSGTRGTLYSVENGYAQFGYDPGNNEPRRIVWLPASYVELD